MQTRLILAFACLLLARSAAAQAADPAVAEIIDGIFASAEHPGLERASIADVAPDLAPLYQAESDRLLWFQGTRPVPSVGSTLATLADAADHGLDPTDYETDSLATQWFYLQAGGAAAAADRALFDVSLSVATARMLRAVHTGRVDPAVLHWGYTIERKVVDPFALLRAVRDENGLAATLEDLQPPFAHYTRARQALRKYRALAAMGEPALVPDLPVEQGKIEPGDAWHDVPLLAARLQVLGDLTVYTGPDAGQPAIYDEYLAAAVRRFQERHGLEQDGIVGPATLGALNVPLTQRIRQIELAMERMRWLPPLGDQPNVFVNVPLFRLWATDPASGEEPLRMNVVVGKSMGHQTPLFIEKMEYVIFRPYWNPPRGITVKELVPRARRDPGYFDREQLEIVASRGGAASPLPPSPENLSAVMAGKLFIRQKPGPRNSLGLAKFIFPNSENVYMHGTPAQQLFSRTRRDFSHGCIRLEDPARFAEWVLRDYPDWPRDRILAAMEGERPTRVNLEEQVTVVLFYDTVHVNSEGVEFFVNDIYGHDRVLDAALAQGYPYPVKN